MRDNKLKILNVLEELQGAVEHARSEEELVTALNTLTWSINVWGEFASGYIAMLRASPEIRELASKGLKKRHQILKELIEAESK